MGPVKMTTDFIYSLPVDASRLFAFETRTYL